MTPRRVWEHDPKYQEGKVNRESRERRRPLEPRRATCSDRPGPLALVAGLRGSPGPARDGRRGRASAARRPRARVRGRHRHRQDARVPRSGDPERQEGRRLDRHARAARADLHQGPAAHRASTSGSSRERRADEGPRNYLCLRRFARAPREPRGASMPRLARRSRCSKRGRGAPRRATWPSSPTLAGGRSRSGARSARRATRASGPAASTTTSAS